MRRWKYCFQIPNIRDPIQDNPNGDEDIRNLHNILQEKKNNDCCMCAFHFGMFVWHVLLHNNMKLTNLMSLEGQPHNAKRFLFPLNFNSTFKCLNSWFLFYSAKLLETTLLCHKQCELVFFRVMTLLPIRSPLSSVYISCQRLVLLYMPYRLLGMSMYTNAVVQDTPDATGFIFLNKMNMLLYYQTIAVKLRPLWHIHPFWMGWQQLSLKCNPSSSWWTLLP